jgi:asparagine synthase (glutamine-hydrolysing)
MSFETDRFFMFLEGRIYGKPSSTIRDELIQMADLIFSKPEEYQEPLAEWLWETDGEFVLFLQDKASQDTAIVTDAMGHLPIFYHSNSEGVIVSREPAFIAREMPERNYDRIGIAQFLMYRSQLSLQTMLRDVYRLGPASVIRALPSRKTVTVETVRQWDFSHRQYESRPDDENYRNVTERLVEACRVRGEASPDAVNVMSLSGGMDSRIVLAGLHAAGVPYRAATFLDKAGKMSADVEIARELAEFVGADWKLCELGLPTGRDVRTLADFTDGRNFLTMSFILPFFDKLIETYGTNMTYFTGDSGLALRSHLTEKKLNGMDDLLASIHRHGDTSRLAGIAEILGLQTGEITGSLEDCLDAYPEDSLEGKYVHYYVAKRVMIWHYDGMDRNRSFFWMDAPLESLPLFHYAINCSEQQRLNHAMFKRVLDGLSSRYWQFNYAQHRAPLGSFRSKLARLKSRMYLNLPPRLRKLAKTVLGRKTPVYPADANLVECIRHQIDNCSTIGKYLDLSDMARISATRSKAEMQLLLTVTSAIEKFESDSSSIDKFEDDILL